MPPSCRTDAALKRQPPASCGWPTTTLMPLTLAASSVSARSQAMGKCSRNNRSSGGYPQRESSGVSRTSAPCALARSANSRIFLALPERSPTVQLVWPFVMRMAPPIAPAPSANENALRYPGRRFACVDSRFRLGCARRTSSAAFARLPACAAGKRLRQCRNRLGALPYHAVAGQPPCRGHAALSEIPFLRRIRIRLGVGGRLPAPPLALLPQAAERRALHAGYRTAPAGFERRRPQHAARCGTGICARLRRVFIALPVSRGTRGCGLRIGRHDAAGFRAIPLAQ